VTPLLYFSLLFPDHAKRLKVGEHLETLFEHIWQFGIIKKGYYGLCHGISGNAYQFISPICRKVLPHKI
jgi:lantibiotic modifying enzyme